MDNRIKTLIDATIDARDAVKECTELLAYPEIQADALLYRKIAERYNENKEKSELSNELIELCAYQDTLINEYNDGNIDRELYLEESKCIKGKIDEIVIKLSELFSLSDGKESTVIVEMRPDTNNLSRAFIEKFFLILQKSYKKLNLKCSLIRSVKSSKNELRYLEYSLSGVNALKVARILDGIHKINGEESGSKIVGNFSSFCYLALDTSVKIEEKDIKIDLFHSDGAGGQNVNKVETGVRVTHLPTNTVVVCKDERSQLKNKERALKNLQTKLNEMSNENLLNEREKQRKKITSIISNYVFDSEKEVVNLKNDANTKFPLTIDGIFDLVNYKNIG